MDCRNCQPTLIDLLYGELATDAAEAARAHLRECASCRAAYDKLAAGLRVARTLEIMEPPAHVEHKLLELAQARAVAIAEQRAAAAPPVLSPWRVAIDFVRRFAMASQVKMVAASALVVTVVLLALPRLLLPAKMTVSMTAEPAASVPAPAAQPVAPAEEGESANFAEKTQRAAEPATATDLDRAKVHDERKSAMHSTANEARRARPASSSAFADKAEMPAKGGKASTGDDLTLNGYRKDAPAPPPAASPRPFPSNDGALAQQAVSKKAKSSEPSDALVRLGSSSPSGLSTRSSASGAGSATVGGMSAGAVKPSSPAVATAAPAREAEAGSMQPRAKESLASRLQTARAIAQHDGCAAALSSYEQVVAAGSSTLEAGEALLDMAHCRISLGQPAIARALLERASRIPGVAPRARAMLENSTPPNAAAVPAAAGPPE